MDRLSTHVLDMAQGRPAAGMGFRLFRREGEEGRVLLAEGITRSDGHAPAGLLPEPGFCPGRYELVFRVADYFRAEGFDLPEPPFLDRVTLGFGLGAAVPCHVALLVTPHGYTTYAEITPAR
nr:hydroxyisourate hydrolase [uncultured Roseococcus sp.]